MQYGSPAEIVWLEVLYQKLKQARPNIAERHDSCVEFLHAAMLHHHKRDDLPIRNAGRSEFEGPVEISGD